MTKLQKIPNKQKKTKMRTKSTKKRKIDTKTNPKTSKRSPFHFPHLPILTLSILLHLTPNTSQWQLKGVGNYRMSADGVSSACNGFGTEEMNFANSNQSIEIEKEMQNWYGFGTWEAEQALKTQDPTKFLTIRNKAYSYMTVHFIILTFNVAFLIFACTYLCYRSYIRAKNRLFKDRTDRSKMGSGSASRTHQMSNKCLRFFNSRRPRAIVYCCSLMMSVVIIVTMFLTARQAWRTLDNGLKRTDCAFSRAISVVENGFWDENNKTGEVKAYYGLYGILTFLKDIEDDYKEIKGMEVGSFEQIYQDALIIRQRLTSFVLKYQTSTVTNIMNATLQERPGLLVLLNNHEYFNRLYSNASYTVDKARELSNYHKATLSLSKRPKDWPRSSIRDYERVIASIIEGMQDVREFAEKLNYKLLAYFYKVVLVSAILLFTLGMCCYISFYTMSYKARKMVKTSVFFQAVFTLFMLALASITNFYGIYGFGYSALAVNGCKFSKQVSEERNTSINFVFKKMVPFVDSCIYLPRVNETADFSHNMTLRARFDFDAFWHLLTPAIKNSSQETINVRRAAAAIDELYEKEFIPRFNYYKYDDEMASPEVGVIPESSFKISGMIDKLNFLIRCSGTEIQLHPSKCSNFPVCKPGDPVDKHNDGYYCIVPSHFAHSSLKGRFPKPCFSMTVIDEGYQAVYKYAQTHRELYLRMERDYREPIYLPNKAIQYKISSNLTRIENQAKIDFPRAHATLAKYDYRTLMSCHTTKEYLDHAIANFCFSLVYDATHLVGYLLYLGPMLTLFGWCNFISVIGTRIKLVEADLHGNGAVFDASDKRLSKMGRGRSIEEVKEGWNQNIKRRKKNKRPIADISEMDDSGFHNFFPEMNLEEDGVGGRGDELDSKSKMIGRDRDGGSGARKEFFKKKKKAKKGTGSGKKMKVGEAEEGSDGDGSGESASEEDEEDPPVGEFKNAVSKKEKDAARKKSKKIPVGGGNLPALE